MTSKSFVPLCAWLLLPVLARAEHTLVKLLDAGSEPRRELRYAPPVGSRQSVRMRINSKTVTTTNGEAQPTIQAPVIEYAFEIKVLDLTPDGFIRFEQSLTDATIINADQGLAPIVEDLKARTAKLKGTSFSGALDRRGFPDEASAKASVPLMGEDKLIQLNKLCVQFPVEPIGVGGRWQLAEKTDTSGIVLESVSTVELISDSNGVLALKITMDGTAPQHKIDVPGVPSEMSSEVLGGHINGQVEMKLNPTQLVPVASAYKIRTDMDMRLFTQGVTVNANIKSDQEMSIATADTAIAAAAAEPREQELKQADEFIQQAAALWDQKNFQGAVTLAEKALVLRRRHLGDGHPKVSQAQDMLHTARTEMGKKKAQ